VAGGINMLVDITHRKEAERQQKLLIDELNHRVKNTLTTVQSIVGQTARNAVDVWSYREAIEARIMAMSRAHSQLSQSNWGKTGLRELLASAFEPHAAKDSIAFSGPPAEVAPRAALMLSMVFHELATNAAKYGALSCSGGKVAIDWSVRANGRGLVLAFRWQESGGPTPQPPKTTGFGMRLIQRGIETELQGKTKLDFAPAGLRCEIEVPLAHAEE
jgi:two-component sensor histidine kinase